MIVQFYHQIKERLQPLQNWLNQLNPAVAILFFIFLFVLLISFRTAHYEYRLSSLLSMQSEFIDLNPDAGFDGLVVFDDSGYDGQFFYLIARSVFDHSVSDLIVDTFDMRMGRIGMSLLAGLPASVIGWQYYSLIALLLLGGVHIASYLVLRSVVASKHLYLTLFYLFSPFSINSSLLLVSDSLMVSVAVLGYGMIERAGFRFSLADDDQTNFTSPWLFSSVLVFCFLVSIRETALFALAPIGLLYLFRRSVKGIVLMILPGIVFIVWMIVVRAIEVNPGASPMAYTTKLAWPMAGFFESISYDSVSSVKGMARELSKFVNLLYLMIIISTFYAIRSKEALALFSPLLLIATLSVFSAPEYWQVFDNGNRMFTLSLPVMILLRDRIPEMRSNGIFWLTAGYLLLLIVRIIWLKPVMSFIVIG